MSVSTAYLGHRLCNLLVPDEPDSFEVSTPSGTWNFQRYMHYSKSMEAILSNGACAITYDISTEVTISGSRTQAIDRRHDELLPICLGVSYLTAMAVRPVQDLPASQIMIISAGDHFPRDRAMGNGFPMAITLTEFTSYLEAFVAQYPGAERTEKARLLIHHWLDALAFWSLEDLTLSTTTILEIIAATAQDHGRRSGKNLSTFNTRINYAADRFRLPYLNPAFRKMRNDLVHEGRLSGKRFPNATKDICTALVAETLNWIDQYYCAVFGFQSYRTKRFHNHAFRTVNAFSLN